MVTLIVSACLHEHMGLGRVETPCSPSGRGCAPRSSVRKSDTHHGGEKNSNEKRFIRKFPLQLLDPNPPPPGDPVQTPWGLSLPMFWLFTMWILWVFLASVWSKKSENSNRAQKYWHTKLIGTVYFVPSLPEHAIYFRTSLEKNAFNIDLAIYLQNFNDLSFSGHLSYHIFISL